MWLVVAVALLAGCDALFGIHELPGDASRTSDVSSADGADDALDAAGAIDAHSTSPFFVQGATAWASPWSESSTTIAATLTHAIEPGSVIAVYVTYASAATVTSVIDSVGNTYAVVDSITDGGDEQSATTAWATATTGGIDTVTVQLSSAQCCRAILVHEISGASASAALDAHSALEQPAITATDQVTSDASTTTVAGDYVFAATIDAANASGQMIRPGTGELERLSPMIPNGPASMSEDEIAHAAGAVTSTFTFSVSGSSLTAQMAFKP
jgi:hypothetical protein